MDHSVVAITRIYLPKFSLLFYNIKSQVYIVQNKKCYFLENSMITIHRLPETPQADVRNVKQISVLPKFLDTQAGAKSVDRDCPP